jgi:hypothetical protein
MFLDICTIKQQKVGKETHLFGAGLDFGGGDNLGERSEAMEEHGHKLDDHDRSEHQEEDHTNGLKLEVRHLHVDLIRVQLNRFDFLKRKL